MNDTDFKKWYDEAMKKFIDQMIYGINDPTYTTYPISNPKQKKVCNHKFKEVTLFTTSVFECELCGEEK